MTIAPKQIGVVETFTDLATGGAVAPANRVEEYRAMIITQTTAGQAITLPNPTDTSVVFSVDIVNNGTASFTMYGVTLTANGSARFMWDGTQYLADVAPTSINEVVENLTPTADNTIPNLANTPAAGVAVKFFVNGNYDFTGGITNAAAVVTAVPATVGFNISASDTVTAIYAI